MPHAAFVPYFFDAIGDEFCDLLDADDFALIERVRERGSVASARLAEPYVYNCDHQSGIYISTCDLPDRRYEPEWKRQERLQPIRLAARREAKQRKRQDRVERTRLEEIRIEVEAAKKAAEKLAAQRNAQHRAAVDAFLREKMARKQASREQAIIEHAQLMEREQQERLRREEARVRQLEEMIAEAAEIHRRGAANANWQFQLFSRQQETARRLLEQVPNRLTANVAQLPFTGAWPQLDPGHILFFGRQVFIRNEDVVKTFYLRGRVAFIEQRNGIGRYVAVDSWPFTLYDKLLAVIAIAERGFLLPLSTPRGTGCSLLDLMTRTGCTDRDELICHMAVLAERGYVTLHPCQISMMMMESRDALR